MNIQDAFDILGIKSGHVTKEDIDHAYRRASMKYHPDRNPAGLEMMQLINAAREALKDFINGEAEGKNVDYGEKINAALNAIITLGLNIEICGAWVWVTGDTKAYKESLKEAGFFWAPKKLAWYFRPEEYKSRKGRGDFTLGRIRAKYGSATIKKHEETQNRQIKNSFLISERQVA